MAEKAREYVIQVRARHGVGSEGWRTVRRPSGEPYHFGTREAALAAVQRHFAALRLDVDVRVQAVPATPSPDPSASSEPPPRRQRADRCP
ncbi:MAG: hypothetical protein KatS3mg131_3835 [Candidatus Tectimicrobiota bacterium]|nr:MAG: hypothetical protein KatS3mg131_3835 [Candidatus Tectomicrobia bacterium]